MNNSTKLLILGEGSSGKDTLAEFWEQEFGLKHKPSSLAAAEIFIFDELKDKYGYESFEQCCEDRRNRREEWYDLITEYNKEDKTRLAREILKTADCYVGMRDRAEVAQCLVDGIFDLVIWVEAGLRLSREGKQREGKGSLKVDSNVADIVIENNFSEGLFLEKARSLGEVIFRK